MISIIIENQNGTRQNIEVPEGISLSLMEVLKASGYNILAACGGMGLCATCHVQVIEGLESISNPENIELAILDTLPDAAFGSRLACQIRVNEYLNGTVIRMMGNA